MEAPREDLHLCSSSPSEVGGGTAYGSVTATQTTHQDDGPGAGNDWRLSDVVSAKGCFRGAGLAALLVSTLLLFGFVHHRTTEDGNGLFGAQGIGELVPPSPVDKSMQKILALLNTARSELPTSPFGATHGVETTGLMQIELIPHHVQHHRHLLEQQKSDQRKEQDDSEVASSLFPDLPIHERDMLPAREERSLEAKRKLAFATKLYEGGGYSTHYVDLWVGQPRPQRQTLLVDTGSTAIGFPCVGCRGGCGAPGFHTDPLFNASQSDTFHLLTCDECFDEGFCKYNACANIVAYAEESMWWGFQSEDMTYIGEASSVGSQDTSMHPNPELGTEFMFDLRFTCMFGVSDMFKYQLPDGIMGLDRRPNSFVNQLQSAGKIPNKSFSLCFARSDQATESGIMTLGGADPRLHKTPMVFSKLKHTEDPGFYSVQIRKVLVFGSKAMRFGVEVSSPPEDEYFALVDSGTSCTFLSKAVAGVLKEAFEALSGGVTFDNNPKTMTLDQIRALPIVAIQLAGDTVANQGVLDSSHNDTILGLLGGLDEQHPLDVLLVIPPELYMQRISGDIWINRLYVSDEQGSTIIGANTMVGHDVLFDDENGRVGWAVSGCKSKAGGAGG